MSRFDVSKVAWWIYFSVLSINVISAPFLSPFDSEAAFALGISAIGLAGLFGYISGRAIGSMMFWRGYFVFLLLVCGFYLLKAAFAIQEDGLYPLLGTIFGVLVVSPWLYALARYSARKHDVWNVGARRTPS